MATKPKLTHDAFNYYVSLGSDRTYQAVADHFGCHIQTVFVRAKKDRWQEKLAEIESKANQKTAKKIEETVFQMNSRHLKALRRIQAKALKALKDLGFENALQATRSYDIAVKQERLIRGEPTERHEISVEEVIKKQYSRWFVPIEETTPN